MGRAQVRQYTQAWFDPSPGSLWATAGGVPDPLDKVWTSFPKRIDFRQWERLSNQKTRAQAVVFVRSQSESRESIGGAHAGWKLVSYDVIVQVFVESYLTDAEAVMTDVDALADALVARARADHNFGQSPTVIFRAAEPDVSLTFGEPLLNAAAATEQWFQLGFTVEQFVSA